MTEHYVIRIYESELEVICDETFDHQEIETGGNLYGLFSHGGSATVFLATRPAGQVIRRETMLELDPEIAKAMESHMWATFGLQGLGMWHSHHWIDLFEPSSGDLNRARHFAAKAKRLRHLEILANFVSAEGTPPAHQSKRWGRDDSSMEPVVRLTPFFYSDVRTLDRAAASFEVLQGESPIRREIRRLEVASSVGADLLRDAKSRRRTHYQLWTSTMRLEGGHTTALEPRSARGHEERRDGPTEEGPTPADPPERGAGEVGEAPVEAEPAPRADPLDFLRPEEIPDPAAFLEFCVNPLLQESGGFEAELHPQGGNLISVIVHGHRRRGVFVFTLGWNGRRPFVYEAQVTAGQQRTEWLPGDSKERYTLQTAFFWGIKKLQGL